MGITEPEVADNDKREGKSLIPDAKFNPLWLIQSPAHVANPKLESCRTVMVLFTWVARQQDFSLAEVGIVTVK